MFFALGIPYIRGVKIAQYESLMLNRVGVVIGVVLEEVAGSYLPL
jgi:hypothetical protein